MRLHYRIRIYRYLPGCFSLLSALSSAPLSRRTKIMHFPIHHRDRGVTAIPIRTPHVIGLLVPTPGCLVPRIQRTRR
ncbi:hypothetical protein F5X98DRAFT_359895 [Xylaria grammica]|nr:hypothetical protein F5X98DRAFT_359895 [Xylaria grammica]